MVTSPTDDPCDWENATEENPHPRIIYSDGSDAQTWDDATADADELRIIFKYGTLGGAFVASGVLTMLGVSSCRFARFLVID